MERYRIELLMARTQAALVRAMMQTTGQTTGDYSSLAVIHTEWLAVIAELERAQAEARVQWRARENSTRSRIDEHAANAKRRAGAGANTARLKRRHRPRTLWRSPCE